jgi:glycosyltransferase involved in cell wall biosynthesis
VHPGAIGLTLFHALAFGTPVVTHNNGALHGPEFAAMDNGCHGLTYRCGSIEDMTAKLISLLKSEARCQEMGRAGQKLVQNKFNTRVMVERFIEIMEQ